MTGLFPDTPQEPTVPSTPDVFTEAAISRAAVLTAAAAIENLPQDYECDPGLGEAVKLLRRHAAHYVTDQQPTGGTWEARAVDVAALYAAACIERDNAIAQAASLRDQLSRAAMTAEAQEPVQLRWGLDDVEYGDDETATVMLSGANGEPYWVELDPERAAALRAALAGPATNEPAETSPADTASNLPYVFTDRDGDMITVDPAPDALHAPSVIITAYTNDGDESAAVLVPVGDDVAGLTAAIARAEAKAVAGSPRP